MHKAVLRAVLPEAVLFRLSAFDHYFGGERELRLLKLLCNPKKEALDIGANVGSYTYFMRWYARHVTAYEPNPQLAERLSRILPDVKVRSAAVSDGAGTLILRTPVVHGRPLHERAGVTTRFESSIQVFDELTVPTLCIDDEPIGEIGFIKIDVEQHELPVLRGALRKIREHRPSVMTEVTVLLYPKELPDMFAFLTEEAYTGFFKFRGEFLPFSRFKPSVHASEANYGEKYFMSNNVIFLPNEKDSSFLPGR
jgi:FkbM family methyltransferase